VVALARVNSAVRQLSITSMRVLILCILLLLAPIIFAQERAPNVRLSKAHPSVYITFDRQGKIASMSNSEIEETVWLRLRNNTRWPIILDMNGVPSKAYGDAALFWDVLCKGTEPAIRRCHACSFNPVPPGHYILFTVPREDLAKGCAIRVKFSYAWEDSSGEPEHFVYYYASDLPGAR